MSADELKRCRWCGEPCDEPGPVHRGCAAEYYGLSEDELRPDDYWEDEDWDRMEEEQEQEGDAE